MAIVPSTIDAIGSWLHDLIVGAILGLAAWGISIESRLNTSKQYNEDLKELMTSKLDGLDHLITVNFNNLDKRLDRVENIHDNQRVEDMDYRRSLKNG